MHITIYERMLEESQRIDFQMETIRKQLCDLPEGNFFCTCHNNYYKWYLSDEKRQTYIPKKNRKLAEQLATRKYLTLLLEDLSQEKKAVDAYLQTYNTDNKQSERLIQNNSEYQRLIAPYFTPISEELLEWQNAQYERNTKYPEQLIHKTTSGNHVRSKSETIIDTYLYMHKIPFRYENPLLLGKVTIYPDFTIRHPRTGKRYFWEHFGLIDRPGYQQTICTKLQQYMLHGIYPSIQLITTYETSEKPLTTEMVEKIIEYYFL